MIAVEKNPCAVVVLAALARELWRDRDVTVMSGDMRHINLDSKADIIVSELLGKSYSPFGSSRALYVHVHTISFVSTVSRNQCKMGDANLTHGMYFKIISYPMFDGMLMLTHF